MTTRNPYPRANVVPPSADEPALDPTINLSHELRTPLTAIQGTLDLLDTGRLGTLSEQGQHLIKLAVRNVDRLMRLTIALEQEPNAARSLSAETFAALQQDLELNCNEQRKDEQELTEAVRQVDYPV